MRGTLDPNYVPFDRDGNTPAYAGNTGHIKTLGEDIKEHPRVCGEHDLLSEIAPVKIGTPPRMRGTHFTLLAV